MVCKTGGCSLVTTSSISRDIEQSNANVPLEVLRRGWGQKPYALALSGLGSLLEASLGMRGIDVERSREDEPHDPEATEEPARSRIHRKDTKGSTGNGSEGTDAFIEGQFQLRGGDRKSVV